MDVSTYLTLIWLVVATALGIAVYVGFGGRALFGTKERPGRILGRRAQLTDLESGPLGLVDPGQPHLPLTIVERFVPEAAHGNGSLHLRRRSPFDIDNDEAGPCRNSSRDMLQRVKLETDSHFPSRAETQ